MKMPSEISAEELLRGFPDLPPLILLDTIEITNRTLRISRNSRKLEVLTKHNRVLQDENNLSHFEAYYHNRGFIVGRTPKGVVLEW